MNGPEKQSSSSSSSLLLPPLGLQAPTHRRIPCSSSCSIAPPNSFLKRMTMERRRAPSQLKSIVNESTVFDMACPSEMLWRCALETDMLGSSRGWILAVRRLCASFVGELFTSLVREDLLAFVWCTLVCFCAQRVQPLDVSSLYCSMR